MFQKNNGSLTRVTRLKVAPNMADPTCIKDVVSRLKHIKILDVWIPWTGVIYMFNEKQFDFDQITQLIWQLLSLSLK